MPGRSRAWSRRRARATTATCFLRAAALCRAGALLAGHAIVNSRLICATCSLPGCATCWGTVSAGGHPTRGGKEGAYSHGPKCDQVPEAAGSVQRYDPLSPGSCRLPAGAQAGPTQAVGRALEPRGPRALTGESHEQVGDLLARRLVAREIQPRIALERPVDAEEVRVHRLQRASLADSADPRENLDALRVGVELPLLIGVLHVLERVARQGRIMPQDVV